LLGQFKSRLKQFVRSQLSPPKTQIWSVGIYLGDSLFCFAPHQHAKNPVLTALDVTDINAVFIADPFMLKMEDTWYMFFEVMNRETGKGQIGLATSHDALIWTYQRIVLKESFHLSYPYVFESSGEYYMIPETCQAKSIRLYKASRFPSQWSFFKTLISGGYFADASIFHYDRSWWLFADTSPHMTHDTLSLYRAAELTGPWLEHPKSPVVQGNPGGARPGGRVMVLDNRIIRYAQNCIPAYGTQVQAFEVNELTPKQYHEHMALKDPVLAAGGIGWNASGIHHVDPQPLEDGRWIACVDGFYWGEYVHYPPLKIDKNITSGDALE
jgi:hypothetical protein